MSSVRNFDEVKYNAKNVSKKFFWKYLQGIYCA